MQIRIALPSKGRISDPAVQLLGKAGIGVKDTANRRLFSETYDEEISVMFTRAADIPEFVADGAADLGMTGLDLIEENSASVEILEDLNFGSAKTRFSSSRRLINRKNLGYHRWCSSCNRIPQSNR